MQEFNYQLSKEDYLDWIHWNVGRQNLKKAQRITAIVFVAFLVIYIGGNIAAKRSPASMMPSLLMMAALGVFMLYSVSAKHQEKVIWKRSGLAKLEKSGGFPNVHLTVREDGITMEVPGEVCKEYSYADIKELQETERLFLLAAASDNTWQFVAKSTFESEEQTREFKALMEEKIADAKENPEKYRKRPERKAVLSSPEGGRQNGESPEGAGDRVYIEPVDTSHMGKIGKMAHIMAAMAANEDAGEEKAEEEKPGEPGAEVAEPEWAEAGGLRTEAAEAKEAEAGEARTEAAEAEEEKAGEARIEAAEPEWAEAGGAEQEAAEDVTEKQ